MRSDKRHGFIVETIHDGTDWCVRDATDADEPDCIFDTHEKAVAAAKQTVRPRSRWYDFSTEVTQ